MLILVNLRRLAAPQIHRHVHDLGSKAPVFLRGPGQSLGPQRKRILIGTANRVFIRQILGCLRHRVDAIGGLHLGIHKAPADRAIGNFRRPGKGGGRLRHHHRSTSHRFHTARNRKADLTRLDRPRSCRHRLHPRTAQPVHRGARHSLWQSRQQECHTGDVAIVLTGLIGAAHPDLFHRGRVHPRIARQKGRQWDRRQVISTHLGQSPGITANRGADVIADERVGHSGLLMFPLKSFELEGIARPGFTWAN